MKLSRWQLVGTSRCDVGGRRSAASLPALAARPTADLNRQPGIRIRSSDPPFKVTGIGWRQELRFIYEQYELRWNELGTDLIASRLCSVEKLEPARTDHRRRTLRHRSSQHPVQDSRPQSAPCGFADRRDRREELVHIF